MQQTLVQLNKDTNIISRFQIVNADSLNVIRLFPDESIPFILTSPPYDDIRKNSKHYCTHFDFEKMAKEIFRVLPAGGVLCWNVGDQIKNGNESLTGPRHAIYFQELGLDIRMAGRDTTRTSSMFTSVLREGLKPSIP